MTDRGTVLHQECITEYNEMFRGTSENFLIHFLEVLKEDIKRITEQQAPESANWYVFPMSIFILLLSLIMPDQAIKWDGLGDIILSVACFEHI